MSREPGAAEDPERAWHQARQAGISRLAIPTPFQVGHVNCYLLDGDPLTLVDTGPNYGSALDDLERELARLGRSVEELEVILVSHQHMDHLGLVEILARRSGAEVWALDRLAPFMERFEELADEADEFAVEVMLRYGIAEPTARALRTVTAGLRSWGSAGRVTRRLAHGEWVELAGRPLQVLHRPGHSPTDTVFYREEQGILIGADHLIAHISSNPLISPPGEGETERPRSLIRYLRSLAATREMPIEMVLPGHGEPVTDHRALIDSRFSLHERRGRKLMELIARGPATAHELATELWGEIALTQAFLTLSEIVGHVDLLVEAGMVREVERGGVVRFEATGGAGPHAAQPLALVEGVLG